MILPIHVICYFLFSFVVVGECCVALHSLTGASEQFETFLSHRGEEMGSIRGRVRIHVPKDRRGTREKVYGASAKTGLLQISASLALSLPTKLSSPLSLNSLTLLWVSHCFLYLVPQWSLAWLCTCWYLSTVSSFGLLNDWPWPDASWDTETGQMGIKPPGQAQHTQTPLCCAMTTPFDLHAPHGFWRSLSHYRISCSHLVIYIFQSGSALRKTIRVLQGLTCLLQWHGCQ